MGKIKSNQNMTSLRKRSKWYLLKYHGFFIRIRICRNPNWFRTAGSGSTKTHNLQMRSQNVWNMSLFEHFFKSLSFSLEARISRSGSGSTSGWKVGSGSALNKNPDPNPVSHKIKIRIWIRINVRSRNRIRIVFASYRYGYKIPQQDSCPFPGPYN